MDISESRKPTVSLMDIIKEFDLEILVAPDNMAQVRVESDDINRPGLQLCGFYDYFNPRDLQIFGREEISYLNQIDAKAREQALDRLFATKFPALVVSRNLDPTQECIAMAAKHGVTLLRSREWTSTLMSTMLSTLKVWLAPQITRHGVLVEIYGEGVLILGDSGIGKSETAIELVKRGHRLIADDAVEIRKVSNRTLVGSAPVAIRHFMEIRGIGVIDVRRIFGIGAVKDTESIDLVVKLENWADGAVYDRLGEDVETINIMDVNKPLITIPVRPGRNLAVVLEVAAMNSRDRKMGHNSAQELLTRIEERFM
ncbi:MAG: HPr(Ser) kinase/phosphatase [Oscillospiraceae bacterium]|nr:HPr(Ser) kinase/phosphatase [Oscillospiraceae bacterium]